MVVVVRGRRKKPGVGSGESGVVGGVGGPVLVREGLSGGAGR